mmetsp:Transcript_106575/g.311545  ORF Transcript_106575/g.311545 Transcript_106575/m.311545 type:complete len:141 (-) Transcript_106575:105-527(-)
MEQLSGIVASLKDLNAYDAGVFHAAARAVMPQISSMTREQRLLWIELYETVRHQGDSAFLVCLRTRPGLEPEQPKDVASDGRTPCRHFIKGYCWMGKACMFSHEPGLKLPALSSTVMLNHLQSRQSDTYKAVGGARRVLG